MKPSADDTLPCLLDAAARHWPDHTALILPGQADLNFAQWSERVTERALSLKAQGVASHQWVVIRADRSADTLLDIFAVLRAGARLLPVNPALPSALVDALMAAHALDWRMPEPGGRVAAGPGGDTGTLPRPHAPAIAPTALQWRFPADDIRTGVLTSGSTGQPKVATHSYTNHLLSAEGANRAIPLRTGDRYLLSLPLFHVGGLAILFRCLLGGASLVLGGRAEDADHLAATGVTHLSMVETQLQRLLARGRPPPGLEAILLGGGPVRPSLLGEARTRGLPCWMSYGLTEMTSQVLSQGPDGRVRVLDHRACRVDGNGEILVRGGTLFKGYLRDGETDPATDDDGWFHTRDLGAWDEHSLRITGRLDNQFISGGENIQPETVEQALHQHTDVVRAVVVPCADHEFGQRPVAFVAVRAPLETEVLRAWLRERLPPFMVPVAFQALPAQADLKVKRQELAQRAEAREPEVLYPEDQIPV
ncbi:MULTISPECIES: o-succinylbenzoate--CoA ligase [unclassified Ectothiorhodospira]|uniref:o-succinylbenzoate--CoA ligase n=1 Tax=unclassified Ectothiorhodospira TaxID=2684909 RepID=UPI001EE8E64B|nr:MULTISPECIES: o-succinylbenzoate--CoA ligase [unclassified Ectothiorhodospira]MCG5516290.1 o-succinylbenzoate--CoA ligase [Ectothiorhodospira sp. 9100]MCG5519331.1 o-succinylbenzoate--CoA ligase [Ectothiorhodospira sp. 9905]